jgi:hypothetical protein
MLKYQAKGRIDVSRDYLRVENIENELNYLL